MNRKTRELADLAKRLGYTVEGYTGGGHVILAHPNGVRYTTPATPSDRRGQRNAIADLERLSGRKLPRTNSRRSRKPPMLTGFSIEAVRSDRRRVRDLHDRRRQLITQARDASRDSSTLRAIPPLLDEIDAIEDQLEWLGQNVDRFDPYTLRTDT